MTGTNTAGAALLSATFAALTKHPNINPSTSTTMWRLRPFTAVPAGGRLRQERGGAFRTFL